MVRLLQGLGSTQAEIADRIGVHRTTVSRWFKRAREFQERDHYTLLEVMAMTPGNQCERHPEMQVGDRKICLGCALEAPFMRPGRGEPPKPHENVVYHQT